VELVTEVSFLAAIRRSADTGSVELVTGVFVLSSHSSFHRRRVGGGASQGSRPQLTNRGSTDAGSWSL
jgi:hypothetical protein